MLTDWFDIVLLFYSVHMTCFKGGNLLDTLRGLHVLFLAQFYCVYDCIYSQLFFMYEKEGESNSLD